MATDGEWAYNQVYFTITNSVGNFVRTSMQFSIAVKCSALTNGFVAFGGVQQAWNRNQYINGNAIAFTFTLGVVACNTVPLSGNT